VQPSFGRHIKQNGYTKLIGAKVMAGKVKLVKIDSREGRAKLAARGVPYYREVLGGLHLGYRKGARRGVWVARRWTGEGYQAETIGRADDIEMANGEEILTFDQARHKALAWAKEATKEAKGRAQRRKAKAAPYLVRDAIEDYLGFLDTDRKSGPKSRALANGAIIPQLGHIALRDLTEAMLKDWQRDLAASARRVRGGAEQPLPASAEARRKRRASANRVWAVLSGALNYVFESEEKRIDTDAAWRRVKPLPEADSPKLDWLSSDKMRALANAAEPSFRALIVAAMHSGARYSELARLTVEDFDPRADTLLIRTSKSGKHRKIVLTEEASAFFQELCAGRAPHEIMLRRADGRLWTPGAQDRPMRAGCAAAGIERVSFHALRHSYASNAAMDGVPSIMIAAALGHSDTRITERNYAHLDPKGVRETLRSLRKPLGLR
jgi:integrase